MTMTSQTRYLWMVNGINIVPSSDKVCQHVHKLWCCKRGHKMGGLLIQKKIKGYQVGWQDNMILPLIFVKWRLSILTLWQALKARTPISRWFVCASFVHFGMQIIRYLKTCNFNDEYDTGSSWKHYFDLRVVSFPSLHSLQRFPKSLCCTPNPLSAITLPAVIWYFVWL